MAAKNDSPQLLIKKREQIKDSNKVLLIWVAIGSILISIAIVTSIFLVKQLFFNQKVIATKQESATQLRQSKEQAKELSSNIKKLRSDSNLKLAQSSSSKNNLDVVLDALPYDGDRISFGSSLQQVLLTNIGVGKFTIKADDTTEESAEGGEEAAVEQIGNTSTIPFDFEVTGSVDDIVNGFKKLDRSIRPIKITKLEVEASGGGGITLKVSAVTYYQEKKTFQLQEKTVKP